MSQKVLDQELITYVQDKFKLDIKRATITLKVAESLYQKCMQDIYDVPKPVEWFLNEDLYRNKWLEREKWFKGLPEDKFKETFYQNDSYKIYLKFMHDQFKKN